MAVITTMRFLGVARQLSSIASTYFNPAETKNAVRAWVQQCKILGNSPRDDKRCHFQVRLEVRTRTAGASGIVV